MFVISLGKGEHCQLAGFYFQPLCFVIVNAGGASERFPFDLQDHTYQMGGTRT